MNKKVPLLLLLILISISAMAQKEFENKRGGSNTGNPFVSHMFTADPSARVFNDKVYVYPSHDLDDAKGFNMRDYHTFSSDDMQHWTDHGTILDISDVAWAKEYMWAPDCIEKNGTYFLYFPAKDYNGDFKIGVATSDSPSGPFLAEPEPIKGSFSVDPGIFTDDDGQTYMYFGGDGLGGQTKPWVAKMDSTMKQFSADPIPLDGIDYWFEACWMHKLGDTYYLSYSTGKKHPSYTERSAIAYATSKSPLGPFEYKGIVNGYVSGWTNHHSIVEFKNQWYFFYHNANLSGGNTYKRSIAADFLHFNDDGSIKEVVQTQRGIGSYDGLARIEAENYHESIGAQKKECNDGGLCVAFNTLDTLLFKNVEFGVKKVKTIKLRIQNGSKGKVELYVDGIKFKSVKVKEGVDKSKWRTIEDNFKGFSGTHDIKLVFKGNNKEQLKLNWFEFSEEFLSTSK